MEISKEIFNARKRANLTQMRFARSLGVSRRAVINWEKGLFIPKNSFVRERLNDLYGIKVDAK